MNKYILKDEGRLISYLKIDKNKQENKHISSFLIKQYELKTKKITCMIYLCINKQIFTLFQLNTFWRVFIGRLMSKFKINLY